jgi:hypothetical protein
VETTTDNRKNQLQKITTSPKLTKAEVNFLVLPYFCLDKDADPQRRIELKEIRKRGNETFEVIWTVSPNPEFGLPKNFERRLQRAVEHSISFLPRPITNPVPLPGFRELARTMGLTCNGRFVENAKQGFRCMNSATIMSKMSYYNKARKTWIEDRFHLYERIVFKGKRDSDGQVANKTYAYFTGAYLDNLNSMYVRPIDFEYLKTLRPIASRLYELLGVKFYGHHDFIQYKYSTLCNMLPLRRQRALSRARQQLTSAHNELKQSGFLESYEWLSGIDGKDDWFVRYVPGERFFKETMTLEYTLPAAVPPSHSPMMEVIGEKSSSIPGTDNSKSFDHIKLFASHNTPEENLLWGLFAGIVKKYHEFDLRDEDRLWFMERVQSIDTYKHLDMTYEIKNWGDWLNIEHRKKTRKESNKFPVSNFKGSLMNWLKQSLNTLTKGENYGIASVNPKGPGRKGFDLPTDYRIDVR